MMTLTRFAGLLAACLATPALLFAEGIDARIVHASNRISTLASDSDSYYLGGTDAFNAALVKIASEYPAAPPIVSDNLEGYSPAPTITVYIYKGTGIDYQKERLQAAQKMENPVADWIPHLPPEVLSAKTTPFEFDWIVSTSATKAERMVSVTVFTGGNIDLFQCDIPSNVDLRIGKKAAVTITTSSDGK